MVKKCFICQIERPNKAKSCTDLVTFSGKSILDIVIETLAVKDVELDAMTCQLCFEVVDEIDAFEQSLKKSKEKLRVKYQVRYEKDDLPDFSNGNDDILPIDPDDQHRPSFTYQDNAMLVDRLLIKANWKPVSEENLELQTITSHFESYQEEICFKTPSKIDSMATNLTWTSALLKHEVEDLSYGIENELQCQECSKSFKTVKDKIDHLVLSHVDNLATCKLCDKDFHSENEAFNHCFKHLSAFTLLSDEKCPLVFKNDLMQHYHSYHRHPKYSQIKSCPFCQNSIENLQSYRRHILVHHGSYVFQCQKCPVMFEDSQGDLKMLEHIKIHNIGKNKPSVRNTRQKPISIKSESNSNTSPTKLMSKKSGYISKSLARSCSDTPLTKEEQFRANFDMALYPPIDPTKVLTSFNEVPENIKEDAVYTLELLRTMPVQITNEMDQLKWDLVLLKCQVTNLTFGIPGESQCFECQDDQQWFNNPLERYDHFIKDHLKQTFWCQICDCHFDENASLESHMNNKHSTKIISEPMSIAADFEQEVTQDGWLKCDLCPSSFSHEFSYWYHKYDSHRRKKTHLKCPVCSKLTTNPMDFKRHILIIHGGFTHACILCGKRYSSRDSIAAHFRSHFHEKISSQNNNSNVSSKKHEKVEICPECGVISKSKLLLDKHVLAAHGIHVPQECQVCHEMLPDPKALVEHKRSVHSNDICYICAKSYLNLSDLNLHISRMHPEMANLGQACPENAKHKPIKLLSTKKDKTMCEICSKMVLTHNIKLHMKKHEEKKVSCPKCPRMFRWNSSLTSHLSSAHGDLIKVVTVSCEYCGKQFKDKSNLRQHKYSHTGGPHSCQNCGRSFGRKDLLNSHESKCVTTTAPTTTTSHVF